MQPAIHIAITAWRRPQLTKRTVESLAKHNDLDEFFCWYGLDGKSNPENETILEEAGFTCLARGRKRRGIANITGRLIAGVAVHGSEDDYMLLLQNDWECCRPIPVRAVQAMLAWPNVGCFRLYGEYKERDKHGRLHHRCNPRHSGMRPRRPVEWIAHEISGERIELGGIHWGHPPAVTKIALAVRLTRGAESEWRSVRRSGQDPFLTARVIENVFWHIGRNPRYRQR